MYNHYVLGILCFISLFMSCNNNRHHREFLDVMTTNIIAENKSSIFFTKYFCRCKNGNVGVLDFKELKSIHSREYANMDYRVYLKSLFAEKITVSWDDIPCFPLDEAVNKRYKSVNFGDFKTHYWEEMPDGALLSKESVTYDNINTVAYFMFKNNFITADSPDEQFGYVCYHYQKLMK